ncbi:MAG: family permease [Cohnella sp.]|nr:family permease [Cohnella sp.]
MSGLKKGALTLGGAVAMTAAFMGPATASYFNASLAVQNSGNAIGFAFLLAMVAVLFLAYTISQFAKKIPSAGFAYTFSVRAFGPRAGFLTGWLLLLGYALVTPQMLSAMGYFFHEFFVTYLHVNISWGIFSVATAAVVLFLACRGVSTSIRVALIMLIIELVVMLAIFLTILFQGGAEGLSVAAFNPANSLKPYDWNGIGTAMMWSILMFVGFESAATLGEETKEPKRNIPRALVLAVVGIGLFFLLAAFSVVIGYGPGNVSKVVDSIHQGTNVWDAIFSKAWGPKSSIIIMLVILNSMFANLLAGFNAAVRVIYAMGREKVIFSVLGEVNEKRQVPVKAAIYYMVVSLILTLLLGYGWDPMTAYGWTGTIVGIMIVLVYVVINFSLIRFYKKQYPAEFSVFKHVIVPLIAVALLYLPLKGVIMSTLPSGGGVAPMTYVLWVALGWIVFGVAYMFYLNKNKSNTFSNIGKVFES